MGPHLNRLTKKQQISAQLALHSMNTRTDQGVIHASVRYSLLRFPRLFSDPLLPSLTRAGAMIAYLAVLTIATIGGIATFASTDTNALKGLYSSSFYQNRQDHPVNTMPEEALSPRHHAACS